MEDYPEYRITNVSDLLNIPPNRVEDCIEDLKSWVAVCNFAKNIPGIDIKTDCFIWVDDKETDVYVVDVSRSERRKDD